MKEESIGLLIVLGGVVLVLWLFNKWPFNPTRQVTVYQAVCAQKRGRCSSLLSARQKIAFRAFPAQQVVVWWPETSGAKFPKKYSSCTVIDSNNWICQAAGVYFHMNEGRLNSYVDDQGRKVAYVSRTCWYLLNYFNSPPVSRACEDE